MGRNSKCLLSQKQKSKSNGDNIANHSETENANNSSRKMHGGEQYFNVGYENLWMLAYSLEYFSQCYHCC